MNWKVRSKLYHKLFTEHSDDLRKEVIIENYDKDAIVKYALEYPVKQTKELYYPAKSYAVAIIFAYLLRREFGENLIKVLDDPDLLAGNDPYFKVYSEDPETYGRILKDFPYEYLEGKAGASENFEKTCEYFYKEMLIHESTKIFAPSH